jgi:hypothetical protein
LKLRAVSVAVLVTVPLLVGASMGGAATRSGTPAQVAAAVAKSTAITKLPSDLTPPLTVFTNPLAAQNYAGSSTVAACDPYDDAKLAAHPVPCYYGDLKSSTTVAFIGDSNTGNWAPAFELGFATTKYRLAVFPYAGCHTPDMTYVSPHNCNVWHKSVSYAIRRLHPYAVIAVSGPFGSVRGATEAQWVAGMKKLFVQATIGLPSTLRILMGTSPLFPEPVPTCLASNSNPQSCSVADTPTSVYGRYLARDKLIAAAASATLVPVGRWLCTSGSCSPIVSKYLVYVDADHITIAYSQFVAQVVMNAVLKALQD